MTASVTIAAKPDLAGKRLAFALAEDRVGHYPEFRAFFAKSFDLDRIGLAEPGFVTAPSGLAYAFVFIGRSGEPFPAGVEIYAVVDALEPVEETTLDADLWAVLGWMIDGVGAPWTRDDLEATGRLYRIPAAAKAAGG
ncbi:hypothetical protein [Chelatococcus reniformis]|uniref:Uncharacterized protein n=1 Tax=Chelatococcus reniformis TaxID=1494448 RepID=A0A916U481_9HYPH|nr:hypothetical protein [Chelatococcus reniformis]GGC60068.1 hypothetical protein GCM10010994_18420 [Chelatococcus reniformis]